MQHGPSLLLGRTKQTKRQEAEETDTRIYQVNRTYRLFHPQYRRIHGFLAYFLELSVLFVVLFFDCFFVRKTETDSLDAWSDHAEQLFHGQYFDAVRQKGMYDGEEMFSCGRQSCSQSVIDNTLQITCKRILHRTDSHSLHLP